MPTTYHFSVEDLRRVSQILMAAARIDGDVDPDEVEAIIQIMEEFATVTGDPGAMAAVRQALDAFDHAAFDLSATCAAIDLPDAEARKALLTALSRLTDADDTHTSQEDAMLRRVAHQIGASDEERDAVTVNFDDIFREDDGPGDDFFA